MRLADHAAPLKPSAAPKAHPPAFSQLLKKPQQHQPLLLREDATLDVEYIDINMVSTGKGSGDDYYFGDRRQHVAV